MCGYVYGTSLPPERASVGNQLLYAVMSNPDCWNGCAITRSGSAAIRRRAKNSSAISVAQWLNDGATMWSWNTMLSVLRDCATPPVIDYWSLDTEGSELAILKSFPFHEYAFRVLTVEHNWLPVREQIREFLENRGCRRIRTIDIDDCCMQANNLPRPAWRSNAWTWRGKRILH
jgi:hypothetical protein